MQAMHHGNVASFQSEHMEGLPGASLKSSEPLPAFLWLFSRWTLMVIGFAIHHFCFLSRGPMKVREALTHARQRPVSPRHPCHTLKPARKGKMTLVRNQCERLTYLLMSWKQQSFPHRLREREAISELQHIFWRLGARHISPELKTSVHTSV